jgi:PhnB protein
MPNAAKPVPQGFHTATPYLIIKGAAEAIEFYKKVFGASEISRQADSSGTVRHGEIKIGDSMLMIADEFSEFPEWRGPEARGGTPVHIYLYVEDCDATFGRAIAAGAKEILPLKDQFYGDRSGGIKDPYGHIWYIATHKEDLSHDEIERRAAAHGRG